MVLLAAGLGLWACAPSAPAPAIDGYEVPRRSWLPDDIPPRAVILGVHGFNDYSNAFDAFGTFAAEHGIAVYAYDQRGFGETRSRGYWAGADTLIDDCADAVCVLREAHPEIPLAVLGESMGGSVALAGIRSGQVNGVDRLILAAPGVRGGVPLRQSGRRPDDIWRLIGLPDPMPATAAE